MTRKKNLFFFLALDTKKAAIPFVCVNQTVLPVVRTRRDLYSEYVTVTAVKLCSEKKRT